MSSSPLSSHYHHHHYHHYHNHHHHHDHNTTISHITIDKITIIIIIITLSPSPLSQSPPSWPQHHHFPHHNRQNHHHYQHNITTIIIIISMYKFLTLACAFRAFPSLLPKSAWTSVKFFTLKIRIMSQSDRDLDFILIKIICFLIVTKQDSCKISNLIIYDLV